MYSRVYFRQYSDYYTYAGEATNITFEALALPGKAVEIRDLIVSQWAERNGLSMIQLIIEDEPVGSIFGFDLAVKYRVEALAHGSPIGLPVVMGLITVVGIAVYGFMTWKTEEVRFGPARSYYDVLQKIIDQNPDSPQTAAELVDKIQKSAPTPPPPSPGPIGEIGDLVKWGIIGLLGVGVVVVVALPTLSEMMKKR